MQKIVKNSSKISRKRGKKFNEQEFKDLQEID